MTQAFTRQFFLTTMMMLMGIMPIALTANAIEANFYDVESLQVRAKGKNELAAKNSAINYGKRQAFREMIARFLTKRDFERLELPKLNLIDDMIRDLQLEEERYGGGIYIATLNIRFRLENVREYLRDIGFAYSETSANPYLILPIFVDLGTKKAYMWEPENIWLDIWLNSKEIGEQHLLPIYLPNHGYHDEKLLANINQVNQDTDILDNIKDYYNTNNVILLTATGDYRAQSGSLNGVEVAAHFLTKDWQRDSIVMKIDQKGDAVKLLNSAKTDIFTEIQDEWKHNTAIEFDKKNKLRVNVAISSLASWLKIQSTLQAVPDVIAFRLVQIGQTEAVIDMSFYGTTDKLARALAREFLSLRKSESNRGEWVLISKT
ncbi:MAG: DUF2066 domain-containing protein [Alphaproteobacteria bacterium]|nr:DUF2066 domain-containing protein [Alphaproteobacteria bacterium]